MSIVFQCIGAVLLMLLGAFVFAVLLTLIVCPICDYFECRKLYNRIFDIELGSEHWEGYERHFDPIKCVCRGKLFNVEVKKQFSVYGLNVKEVFINGESALTVWKSESMFLKYYGHNYASGKNCCEVEEIIKQAQNIAQDLWNDRLEEGHKKDSYFNDIDKQVENEQVH